MRIINILISACLLYGNSIAHQKTVPQFEHYPVAKIFKAKPAPVRISGARARKFQTRIREGAKKGPNFAGHYTIVTWGCGSGCLGLAFVDAQTGRVQMSADVPEVISRFNEEALQYRINSKLLIVVGWLPKTMGREFEHKYYYTWERGHLRLIRSTKKE